MIRPILQYPGNKWRLRGPILARLARYEGSTQFREPFAGTGAISLAMIDADPRRPIWINDLDVGVYCMWKAMRDHPDLLLQRVRDFAPSSDAYGRIRAYLGSGPIGACDHDIVHIGFCKLVLHCLSFSAMGLLGGPPRYMGKRWSPSHLCENIARLRHHIDHVSVTNTDYKALILDESRPAVLYIDPPYLSAGPTLYTHFLALFEDHVELAQRLRRTPHAWVLSYDNCPQIRDLYDGWADVETIPVKYMISGILRAKAELLISSRRLSIAV